MDGITEPSMSGERGKDSDNDNGSGSGSGSGSCSGSGSGRERKRQRGIEETRDRETTFIKMCKKCTVPFYKGRYTKKTKTQRDGQRKAQTEKETEKLH